MTEFAANGPDTASSEDMRGELRRLFDAPQFNRSPVMRRLLSYLVEQTLAGNGHRLKAYTIAVDGLGRDQDFDARIDSYPRVQVGRLRKLLGDFYAAHDPCPGPRITIPKGAYIVRFGYPAVSGAAPGAAADGCAPAGRARPGRAAFPFANLGRFAAAAFVAAVIGLFAWQALGGLARADGQSAPPRHEFGARTALDGRCAKPIGAERCRAVSHRRSPSGAS